MIIPNPKENLKKNIEVEIQLLDTNISNYEVKSKILSTHINSKNGNNNVYSFYSLEDYSTKLNSYISSLNDLKNSLNELLSICENDLNDGQIDQKIEWYNSQSTVLEKENVAFLLKLNTFIYSSMKTYRSDLKLANYKISQKNIETETKTSNQDEENSKESNKDQNNSSNNEEEINPMEQTIEIKVLTQLDKMPQVNTPEEIVEMEKQEITDNNTLIISEMQNKVFLPYTVKDLEDTLAKNKNYNTLEEVISNLYILPLDKYKSSNKSRFKETYDLMRKKEKASIFESLNVAFEQTFNSSLNPAIITACKNLSELDVYLDCLDSNETSKFPFFEIKYEAVPTQK